MLRSIKQLFLVLFIETLLMVIFFRLRRAIGKVRARTENWSIQGQKMSMRIFVEDVKFRRLDNKIRKMFEFIWGEKFTDIQPTDSAGVFTTMESEFKKWGIPVKIEYRIHGTSLLLRSMIL